MTCYQIVVHMPLSEDQHKAVVLRNAPSCLNPNKTEMDSKHCSHNVVFYLSGNHI